MIAILQNCSHLVFTDLALLMVFEFRIFTWTPSVEQMFRSQYNIQLTLDCIRAFLVNGKVVRFDDTIEDQAKTEENTKSYTNSQINDN